MNATRKLVPWIITLFVLVFLCGILPRLAPTILPPLSVEAEPVFCLGGSLQDLCAGGFGVTNTLIATLLVDAALIVFFYLATRKIQFVPSGLQNFFESIVEILYNQAQQVAGKNAGRIFAVGATIFLFVFFANYSELLPGVDSIGFARHAEGDIKGYELSATTPVALLNPRCPALTAEKYDQLSASEKQARAEASCQTPVQGEGTAVEEANHGWQVVPYVRTPPTDINVTLALALMSVIATQIYGVMGHMPHDQTGARAVWIGLKRYVGKFFNVAGLRKEGVGKIFGAVDLFASLLELLSEFVKIISFTFRLFGNIFAGTVLIFVVMSLIPYIGPVAPLLLETFVGVIQAYVFMMLTFVFMSTAAQSHGEGEH